MAGVADMTRKLYATILLIVLLVLGALLRENFIFTVVYLLAGAYALSRWWSRKALASITAQRKFPRRLFLEEEAPVTLILRNIGLFLVG